MLLYDFFSHYPNMAIAFSGGVDSAYLLLQAKLSGIKTHAYYADTPFQPEEVQERVKFFAELMGIPLKIVDIDLLSIESVINNSELRCYYCKKTIMSTLLAFAEADGFTALADGTNADDNVSERPGMKALKELSVLSPLSLCGITKKEIREELRKNNIPFWNIPSYSCLASRIPYNTRISLELLKKIKCGEQILAKLGFIDYRLRYIHGSAKLELQETDMLCALQIKEKLLQSLHGLFDSVVLDLKPRSPGK